MRVRKDCVSDLTPIWKAPSGAPRPFEQPESDGWFGEKGRCGPTAIANLLMLSGIRSAPTWRAVPMSSPQGAIAADATRVNRTLFVPDSTAVTPALVADRGVEWAIGSLPAQMQDYLKEQHGITSELYKPAPGLTDAQQSARAMQHVRDAVANDKAAVIWYATAATQSHYVTIVDVAEYQGQEQAVVMSWGGYYRAPLADLVDASSSIVKPPWVDPYPILTIDRPATLPRFTDAEFSAPRPQRTKQVKKQ